MEFNEVLCQRVFCHRKQKKQKYFLQLYDYKNTEKVKLTQKYH